MKKNQRESVTANLAHCGFQKAIPFHSDIFDPISSTLELSVIRWNVSFNAAV